MERKVRLPAIKNEDEERAHWADIDLSGHFEPDDFKPVSFPNLKPTSRSISIRFPEYVHAKAEDLPFDDNSFDIITCTYLFHEIPFDVRKAVAREMFRAVKPGGICVITDSFQRCDRLARPQLQCWPAHLTHGRVLCAAR